MLDYQLSKDITTAIEQNLPKQVGDVLTKRLQEGSAAEKALERELAEHKITRADLESRNAEMAKHASITTREAEVVKREQAVLAREQKAELNEFKVQAANDKCGAIFSLVERVFRNPVITHSKTTSEQVPISGPSGVGTWSASKNEFTTEEIQ